MNRRELLGALSMVGLTAASMPVLAQHEHHNHEGPKHQALADAAGACAGAAEACLSHCVDALAEGDKSLQICAGTSRETAAVCRALQSLAAQNSPHLASVAKVSAEICKACEAECRKHSQHPTCTACAESCATCAKECEKVSA